MAMASLMLVSVYYIIWMGIRSVFTIFLSLSFISPLSLRPYEKFYTLCTFSICIMQVNIRLSTFIVITTARTELKSTIQCRICRTTFMHSKMKKWHNISLASIEHLKTVSKEMDEKKNNSKLKKQLHPFQHQLFC